MKTPLPPDVAAEEVRLGKLFQAAKKAGDNDLAERTLLDIWALYPSPKALHAGSLSLVTVIALFYLEQRRLQEAEQWAHQLFACDPPREYYKPYLVLGKVYHAQGELDKAATQLLKAYEYEGKRGFAGEDPALLAFTLARRGKS